MNRVEKWLQEQILRCDGYIKDRREKAAECKATLANFQREINAYEDERAEYEGALGLLRGTDGTPI